MKALRTSCLSLSLAALAWSAGCAGTNQTQPQAPVRVTNAVTDIAPRSEQATSLALPPEVESAPPKETAGTPTAVPDPTGTPAPARAMSDGEIAGILSAVIDGELNQAKVASKRTKNTHVRRFADRIVADEGAAGAELTALEARHPMVSQSTKAIEDQRTDNANALTSLRGTPAAKLDDAFLTAQIAETARLIALLDDTLLAAAEGTELKSQVASVRAMIATHAKLAEEAQTAYREHHAAMTATSTP